MRTKGYCIFVDTICEGPVPIWRDERGYPVVYPTEREAQVEIAEYQIGRLQNFLAGDREYEDAISIEDYVLEVEVTEDGSVITASGQRFGKEPDQ